MLWTEFDILMFIWRAIIFLFVTAVLIVASIVTRNSVLYKDDYLKDNPKTLKIRWTISAVLYLVGVTVGGLAIYELITGNPNGWLVFKIGMYIIIWVNTVLILLRCVSTVAYYYVNRGPVLCITCFLFLSLFCWSATVANNSEQQTKEETLQVAESKTLIAVNDSLQKEGKAGSVIFFTVFAISEKDIYKYYWQDEDGGIRSGSVESKDTVIYYTKEGEVPHLDKMEYAVRTIGTRNNEQREKIVYIDAGFKLYIPEGSITESYSLDLQ